MSSSASVSASTSVNDDYQILYNLSLELHVITQENKKNASDSEEYNKSVKKSIELTKEIKALKTKLKEEINENDEDNKNKIHRKRCIQTCKQNYSKDKDVAVKYNTFAEDTSPSELYDYAVSYHMVR